MATVEQQYAAEPVTTRNGSHSGHSASPVNIADRTWSARLKLSFEKGKNKTILRREHTGPLMVQRPFYPEDGVCHTYLLHPPSGIVGGDRLSVSVRCGDDAQALLTTPGANRYYGSDGRIAKQEQQISVSQGALEWFPMETIFFNQCVAEQKLNVDLAVKSRFSGWDILCFGRPAGEHHFKRGNVTSHIRLTLDQKPLLTERLQINDVKDIHRATGLRGSVVAGTLFLISPDINRELLEYARAQLPGNEPFAITLIDQLMIVRYLGHSAEQAKAGFTSVWQALRPAVMQHEANTPRIWAT